MTREKNNLKSDTIIIKVKNRMKKEEKKATIKKYQTHIKDTGSPIVQIAILTKKIESLSNHLKTHSKDKHSRRGLLGMVGNRRSLLRYLQQNNSNEHAKVIKDLGLRK